MPDVKAELAASFSLSQSRTQRERKYHSAPLKIAKTFRYATPERDPLAVYVMDCSPGLMSGDDYRFDVELGGGTSVFWTNQSFTKVHPSLGTPSVQQQTIRIDEGAMPELMPEPVMLYAGASLDSETDIRMESGSTLMYGEVLCPGRTHRGESCAYERFAAHPCASCCTVCFRCPCANSRLTWAAASLPEPIEWFRFLFCQSRPY